MPFTNVSTNPSRYALYGILGITALAAVAAVAGFTPFGQLIKTQVAPSVGQQTLTGVINASLLSQGGHTLSVSAKTANGDLYDTTRSFLVLGLPPAPPAPPSQPSGGGSSGGGGGGGGGGSGGGGGGSGGSSETIRAPKIILTFQPEKAHTISGSFSGIMKDGKRTIVRLAHGQAVLEKTLKVPTANYWLEITAKDDKPGPVQVAIYLNNKRWKTVTLTKNNDQYRTVRVGMLRKFKAGTIRFQLLNDVFDRKNPTNAAKDRNFDIDSWRLVSDN